MYFPSLGENELCHVLSTRAIHGFFPWQVMFLPALFPFWKRIRWRCGRDLNANLVNKSSSSVMHQDILWKGKRKPDRYVSISRVRFKKYLATRLTAYSTSEISWGAYVNLRQKVEDLVRARHIPTEALLFRARWQQCELCLWDCSHWHDHNTSLCSSLVEEEHQHFQTRNTRCYYCWNTSNNTQWTRVWPFAIGWRLQRCCPLIQKPPQPFHSMTRPRRSYPESIRRVFEHYSNIVGLLLNLFTWRWGKIVVLCHPRSGSF